MWEDACARKEPVPTYITLECYSVNLGPAGGAQLLLFHPEESDGAIDSQMYGV